MTLNISENFDSHKWIHILSPVKYHRHQTDETKKMLDAQHSLIKNIVDKIELQNSKIETILNKTLAYEIMYLTVIMSFQSQGNYFPVEVL